MSKTIELLYQLFRENITRGERSAESPSTAATQALHTDARQL